MKTFEEVKGTVKNGMIEFIKFAKFKQKSGVKGYDEKYISSLESDLQYLDEATIMAIGCYTNDIIRELFRAYHEHKEEYSKEFDKFIINYVLSNKNAYNLGLSLDDFQCYRGQAPKGNEEAERKFKARINKNFGTQVPLFSEVIKAYNDAYKTSYTNEEERAKALIRSFELQRDAGVFKIGDEYHFLENNFNYLKAKEMCDKHPVNK